MVLVFVRIVRAGQAPLNQISMRKSMKLQKKSGRLEEEEGLPQSENPCPAQAPVSETDSEVGGIRSPQVSNHRAAEAAASIS